MQDRVVPDDTIRGAFVVRFGDTSQSWVDPSRPDFLAYEYVQHVAMVLDHSVLRAPEGDRLRVVHIGGAAMSLPRWVAWRRPQTAQIVCEPDSELTEEVRRKIPLPPRSGIKVRDVDGRAGVAAMPDDYADAVVVDAFAGSSVPGELVTAEAFDELRRIGRGADLTVVNITDKAPFHWAKRVAAAMQERWRHLIVGAEVPVHKGKRFGNLIMAASSARCDVPGIRTESNKLPFGYRWLDGKDLSGWIGGAEPFTDAAPQDSPEPSGSKLWFS